MSRIFLSHSSANNAEAVALPDWLVGEGWDDLFLDLDPTRGLVLVSGGRPRLRPPLIAAKWCFS
jgi:hypothetical protein